MLGDVPPQPLDDGERSLLSPTFAVVMLASFAYFTAMGALLPTVPRYIEDELGGGGFQVGFGVGVMAVSAAVLRPWVGRIGDTKGRRVLTVAGCATVAVSIVGYALATEMWMLIGLRLLTGAGEAAVFVGVATAAQDLAPDHRRGEAASYFSVSLYAGLALGPIIGEALVDQGFTTLWRTVGLFAAVAAVVGLWIPRGKTVEDVGGRPFLQPDALWPGVILLLGLIPFTAFAAFGPLYAEDIGLDGIGGVFAVYAGLVLVIRIVGARLPDRLGWRTGSFLALCGVTVGIWLVAAWGSSASLWLAAIGLGAGMSLLYPSLFTAVMAAAPEEERTHAVGTFSVFFDLSQGFGAPLVGLAVSLGSGNERIGFAVAGALAFSGLTVQWLLRDRIGGGARETAATPIVAD
ncbi:MAG TPA: MFS transporter [Acidimicrobiales bacterium]|nr:MFS transporter [Acidimicrobiales bacterium]